MANLRFKDIATTATSPATDDFIPIDGNVNAVRKIDANKFALTSSLAPSATTDTTNASNITSGTLADARIASTLTGKTYNGVNPTSNATGFQIAGGTTSKTLTVSNTLTIAGTDSSTLNIGTGGTLGSAAFTASTNYATSAQGTKADNVGAVNGIVKSNGSASFSAASAGTDYLAPSGSGASLTGITAAQVGLENVTNDTQTKAAVVPNTTPTSGQILVGNSGGTAYAPVSVSGDVTIASTGTTTIGSSKVTNSMLAGSIDLTTKVTGTLPVANGGTNATTAADARTSLGLVIGTDVLAPSGSGASLTGITATQVGLGNVTNNAQTQAAIVPNTAPSAGQILVGNAGGTAYAPVTSSGDVTVSSTGAFTIGSSKVTNTMLAGSIDLTTKVTGALPIANGGTAGTTAADARTNLGLGSIATQAASNVSLTGGSASNLKVFELIEDGTVSATAATGALNYDVKTQTVLYYTSNASGNWTLNIRGDGSTSLDSLMATGDSITLAFLVTQGSTAYYPTALTVDGASVTPKWQGGTAPTAGNASGIDAYSYTVIKTASATFTVLAAQTQFK